MAPAFQPFAVERFLSRHEHGVRFNFSESGVHPMRYEALLRLADADAGALLAARADYPQVNGTDALRERIAALYPGAGPANVLVTVGATEANTLAAQVLLAEGGATVAFRPTYAQFPGNAANLGHEVRHVDLRPEAGWALDGDALDRAARGARVIHVVNPSNPTGRAMDPSERRAVVDAAAREGAWIVADEVYAGTERAGERETPSFWGEGERVVAIGSLSKAYGLPGLRLGWMVAPEGVIEAAWRRHEYAAIAAPDLSMRLAELALRADVRPQVIARSRRLIRQGFDALAEAVDAMGMRVRPPDASAMSFIGFDLPIGSEALAARLLERQDLLMIPGALFGAEGHFRFSSALPEAHLAEGLRRLALEVDAVRAEGLARSTATA
ncbi:aminotransferase class I/II-fold pyridoxal phosphate-dependent enzyme [Jannaschia sp. W003]|uniref:aminotransferase class I/II-fold pyridoxal phosphate-dependent enzyme n=1 Tax=Jannaschia sp. W003 TaxID=2867012 RepID=UPI0021A4E11C|nr:aminotransferase class I/II-fold pyridoxal phosphate-dependent enzyme [Jannaschia sp. W003]UWQ20892.1 aminotransferase class I/II-fold pyridoxal phosphate-dependent enzyme [Jannaschia sp. W003]